jgi:uncharacterized protein (TIGR00369 family)
MVEIEVPFSDGVSQQHGFFHGSVTGAIGDSACGYAAMTLTPPGTEVLTIEYKVNFLSPAPGGSARRARARHEARTHGDRVQRRCVRGEERTGDARRDDVGDDDDGRRTS